MSTLESVAYKSAYFVTQRPNSIIFLNVRKFTMMQKSENPAENVLIENDTYQRMEHT